MDGYKQPLVSIVVPVYNAAVYLNTCVDAIANQTYPNIELLLVNDGSTDNSLEICQGWSTRDFRIKVLSHENQGVSATRNAGIRQCHGHYIAFVDADDIIAPTFVETLVHMMEQGEVDCAVVNWVSGKEHDASSFTTGNVSLRDGDDVVPELFGRCQGFLWNKLYKMEIIRNKNLELDCNILISEDLLFNAHYFQFCKRIAFFDGVQYFYRQHGGSAINRLNNLRWFDCLKVYDRLDAFFRGNDKAELMIDYVHESLLLQAKYRMKYVDPDKLPNLHIEENIRKIESRKRRFTSRQRVKLFLLKMFPGCVMRYKRRMVK